MSARYDLYRNPNPKGKGEVQPLHARFVPERVAKADVLYARAANGTTFNPGEVKAAMGLITEALISLLDENCAVELGEIGTVTLSLTCPPVMERNKIRSRSVHATGLNLRLSREMKSRLSVVHLERVRHAAHSVPLDEAQRDAALTAFFANHTYLTRRHYEMLRSCRRSTALRELNKLIAAGRLTSEGIKASTIYLPVAGNFGVDESMSR